jgi:hypothetical protein
MRMRRKQTDEWRAEFSFNAGLNTARESGLDGPCAVTRRPFYCSQSRDKNKLPVFNECLDHIIITFGPYTNWNFNPETGRTYWLVSKQIVRDCNQVDHNCFFLPHLNIGWSKRLSAPDDYSTKPQYIRTVPTQLMIWRWPSHNTFGMRTVLYWTRSWRTQFGVSINVWRLAGDTLKITCNFLYCNHQVHRDVLITLYTTFIIYSICVVFLKYIIKKI